jgi:GxxExxY protein
MCIHFSVPNHSSFCNHPPTGVRARARPKPKSDDSVNLYEEVARAARVVYAALGPGLSEVVYQNALCLELTPPVERERVLPVFFKGSYVGTVRPDIVLDGRVVLELKAVARLNESHQAQTCAYLRWMPPALEYDDESGRIFGMVINFGPNAVEMIEVAPPWEPRAAARES